MTRICTITCCLALGLEAAFVLASSQPRPREQEQFWASLTALCGKAYEGKGVEAPPGNTTYTGKRLVMHVRRCEPDAVYIPFHVGENRSRSWVITRTNKGLLLRHDHRHEDGYRGRSHAIRRSHDRCWHDGSTGISNGQAERRADDMVRRIGSREGVRVWPPEGRNGSPLPHGIRSL